LVPDSDTVDSLRDAKMLRLVKPDGIGKRCFYVDMAVWKARPDRGQVLAALKTELDAAEFRKPPEPDEEGEPDDAPVGKLVVPAEYATYAANEGVFQIAYPKGWKVGGGLKHYRWASFKSGGAEVRVR
jgi:hypothetical protein